MVMLKVISTERTESFEFETVNSTMELAEETIECFQEQESVPSNRLELIKQNLHTLPHSLFTLHHLEHLSLDYNLLKILPDSFASTLVNLKYLSLDGNLLSVLPDNFGDLANVEELHVAENGLIFLPLSFCNIKALKVLNLENNHLTCLPDEFGNLSSLTELCADTNHLYRLPSSFGQLKNLVKLDMGENNLQELPQTFGSLESLTMLDLKNNDLKELPPLFKDLSKLESLDLSRNSLEILPEDCAFARTITSIFLDNNYLVQLPGWFSQLGRIVELSLKGNALRRDALPSTFELAVELKQLDLCGNFLTELPESFGNLQSLEFLDLGSELAELERRRNLANGNHLLKLPNNFGHLCSLTELRLDENLIEELPESFGMLSNLEVLDLNHNNLQTLPDSFCNLSSLTVCMLSMNYLTKLPEKFGQLTNIYDLRLDNNQLPELPDSMKHMVHLKTLDLFMNHLTTLPECLKYFRKLNRLALGENHFGKPASEIPEIKFIPKYLEKDSNHSINDWRGRKRADLIHKEMFKVVNGDRANISDEQWTRLQTALSRSESIWKGHKDESDSETSSEKRGYIETQRKSPVLSFSEEEFWDIDLLPQNNFADDDEELLYPAPVLSIGSSPVKKEIVLPSINHPKSVKKKPVIFKHIRGQFDNAD